MVVKAVLVPLEMSWYCLSTQRADPEGTITIG